MEERNGVTFVRGRRIFEGSIFPKSAAMNE
jgi:hypothetical protein